MPIVLLLAWFLFSLGTPSSANQNPLVDVIPVDTPLASEMIFRPQFQFKGTHEFEAGFAHTSGDKFINSRGFRFGYRHWFGETFGASTSLSLFFPGFTPDAGYVVDVLASDPAWTYRLAADWAPLYAKLLVGNQIFRLRFGVSGGVMVSNMRRFRLRATPGVYPQTVDDSIISTNDIESTRSIALGPEVGFHLQFLVGKLFFLKTGPSWALLMQTADGLTPGRGQFTYDLSLGVRF